MKNSCTQSSELKTGGCANIVLTSSLLSAHQQNETSLHKRFYCLLKLETLPHVHTYYQWSIVKEDFLQHAWDHLMSFCITQA